MRHLNAGNVAGKQAVGAISLYGNGELDGDLNDIYFAFNNSKVKDWKIQTISAHADFLATNTSTGTGVSAILKVYTIIPKKDADASWGDDMQDSWESGLDNTTGFAGATSIIGNDGILAVNLPPPILTMQATNAGVTPFDSTVFCERFTILKVKEYILKPGETVSWNQNVMRRGVLKQSQIETSNAAGTNMTQGPWALKGWTKTELMVWHGIPPSPAVNSLAGFYPTATIAIVCNKTYTFTVGEDRGFSEMMSARDFA